MKQASLNSEYGECVALAEYLELLKHQGRILDYSHIPNETYTTSWNQKMKNKRQGVKKGFPDYIVVMRLKTLFIEMKKTKGGTVSQEQKEWIWNLSRGGCDAVVCHGFDEAKIVIDECVKFIKPKPVSI